jgi:type VI secretion system protein ImpM
MRCGLYGKLPAKRDFVSLGVPRNFLRIWEPWLDQGLRESRADMGLAEWTEAFASAPIWRFWLGRDLCGKPIVGAIMPSMDACGRFYPLTLVGAAESGEVLAPPTVDPHFAWYDEAETFLLATLDGNTSFDATREALARLSRRTDPAGADGEDAGVPLPAPEAALQKLLAALALAPREIPVEQVAFFWTLGGEDYPPAALMHRSMPAPRAFARLLSDRFTSQPEPCPQPASPQPASLQPE